MPAAAIFHALQHVFLSKTAKGLYGHPNDAAARTNSGRVEQPVPMGDNNEILVLWKGNLQPSLVPQSELVKSRPVWSKKTVRARVGNKVRIARVAAFGSITDFNLPNGVTPPKAIGVITEIWGKKARIFEIRWYNADETLSDNTKSMMKGQISIITDRIAPEDTDDEDEEDEEDEES